MASRSRRLTGGASLTGDLLFTINLASLGLSATRTQLAIVFYNGSVSDGDTLGIKVTSAGVWLLSASSTSTGTLVASALSTEVPEPASLGVFGLATAMLAHLRRRGRAINARPVT